MKLFSNSRNAVGESYRASDDAATKSSRARVRKAVFPVAGLGTRFLPATKAVAKEMLPIVDRPLIQYAVDEALAAGIEEMIFVTNRTKRAIEDYFDRAVELENELENSGKHAMLEELAQLAPPGIRFSFVRQSAPLGLGHAIQCARHLIGDEPFAVLLPDDLMDGEPPVLAQMVEYYERVPASLIAVQKVKREETSRYGIVDAAVTGAQVTRIRDVVEKPHPDKAPSTLAIVGRYIFTPTLLDCLDNLKPGAGGEIQLTDAIARLITREPVLAFAYHGQRFDCGSKAGFLEATLAYGLKHPELGAEFEKAVMRAAHRIEPQASPAMTFSSGTARNAPLKLVAN